jgi:hypothetical protein
MKIEFSQQIFEKNTQISKFMKIPPVEAELSHVSGRTDMTKLVAIFRNFAKAPRKVKI